MARKTREEQVRRFIFGTSRFPSESREFATCTLSFVFLGLAAFLLLESLELRDLFFGFAFLLFLPLFVLNAWAIWRDSVDGLR